MKMASGDHRYLLIGYDTGVVDIFCSITLVKVFSTKSNKQVYSTKNQDMFTEKLASNSMLGGFAKHIKTVVTEISSDLKGQVREK